jgi:hypothetical protein
VPDAVIIGGQDLALSAGVLVSRPALAKLCSAVNSPGNDIRDKSLSAALLGLAASAGPIKVIQDPVHFSPASPRSDKIHRILSTVAVFGGLGTRDPLVSTGVLAYDILELHTLGPRSTSDPNAKPAR